MKYLLIFKNTVFWLIFEILWKTYANQLPKLLFYATTASSIQGNIYTLLVGRIVIAQSAQRSYNDANNS